MDEGFNMRKRKSSSSSSQQSRKNTALSKRARRNPKSTHNTQHNTKKPSLELFWNLPSFLSKGDDAVCRRVSEQCNSKRRRLRLCNNTAAAATSVCAVLMMWRKIKVFPSSLRRSKTIKNHLNFTFTFEFTLFSASLTAQLKSTWSYRWMAWNRVETKHVPATTSRSGERRREPKSTAELKIGLRWWWRKHELERRLRNSEKFLFVFIALASAASSCMPSTTVEVSCVVVFISFVVSPFVLDTISSDLRISFGGRAKTRALCCYDVMNRALFGNLLFTSLFFESTVWEMETWTRKLNDGIWRVSDVDLCCCSSTWNFSFTFFLRGDEEMRDEICCVWYMLCMEGK